MEKGDKTIWGLLGKNKGDNTQTEVLCRTLAGVLGVEPVFKSLTCQSRFVAPNLLRSASLSILSQSDRQKLKPEWPDILIGTGRKSVAVARWVQKQSGGRTRLVWIGRPKAPLNWFDLVVSTPQYGLPDAPNLYKLPLPLVPETIKMPVPDRWKKLSRPFIGVLVGGESFPLLMDDHAIARLAGQITALQEKDGGTCLVTTSPRTGKALAKKLQSQIPESSDFYFWQRDGENPYGEILACADRFIVTGDSATMLAEACKTGNPVEIFALKRSPFWPHWRVKSGLMAWLVVKGILAPPRDVSAIHDILAEQWPDNVYSQEKQLKEITERVRSLYD